MLILNLNLLIHYLCHLKIHTYIYIYIYIYIYEKYDYSNKMQYMQIANNIFFFLMHKTSVLLANMHHIKSNSLC